MRRVDDVHLVPGLQRRERAAGVGTGGVRLRGGRDRGAVPAGQDAAEDVERVDRDVAQLLGLDDGVDQAVPEEVLGGLDALGERRAVERLVDAGAEEADERAGLRGADVAEGAEAGEHAAGRGVAQVDEVGQARGAVRGDGGGDLHHLEERDRALLHAGAAGRRAGDHRDALGGGALDGAHEALGGGDADRAGEEGELGGDDGDPAAGDPGLAGDDRLVEAGAGPRGGELGGVLRVDRPDGHGRVVPAGPAAGVDEAPDEVAGAQDVPRRALISHVR